ncbi:glycosyl hydrolase 53 family protein [Vibrio tritonius]|uniref:Arabinogalactan endo-beta-1,4-galactanase n=1 Tax=Vibrio tritonius TaxID=1435069 RepID=A0ABS7YL87_9VIBR|nr:glycosyl hydrolase 53 family protein [Vibrio tritonius]MCA2016433.1 glycosyl hydrolase 53 family protein [Vibrio tritonius]
MKLSHLAWAVLGLSVVLTGCQSTEVGNTSQPEETNSYVIAPANVRPDFIKGMDVSMLPELEALGAKYYDQGKQEDAITIMQAHGINYIRARLWVNPQSSDHKAFGGGNSTLDRAIELGKRAHAHGMKYLLDIHYSDFWTDPGKQMKPQSWEKLPFDKLVTKVYDYTDQVMKAHRQAGVVPDMVQVGNELNSGMLWPDGKSWGGDGKEFDRLSKLLKAGIKGVRDNTQTGETIPVMLHLAKAGDNGAFRWWFDEITKHQVQYDVIGMSYYPFWHGPMNKVQENLNDVIARYHKPVMLVETSFPFTSKNGDSLANGYAENKPIEGYPISVNGQAHFLNDIMMMLNNLPNKMGLGIVYWEPEWLPVKGATWATKAGMDYTQDHWAEGNSWENQALFDFQGNTLPSMQVFNSH